jgi:uncharacterized protein YciI
MLYAIIWEDVEDSLSLRRTVRSAHLERVGRLINEGRLVLGGPFPALDASDPGPAGFTGSLIVAEFPSLIDAEEWIGNDPYCQRGVIKNLTVKPFVQVVP